MNQTVNEDTREEYLRLFKEAQVERVFLAICDLWTNAEKSESTALSLKSNIKFFRDNGIDAAIWVGVTVGHGATLSHEQHAAKTLGYAPLVNLDGVPLYDTRCPLDKNFRADLSDFLVFLARETGARTILLDDDFRLSQHGAKYCCCCEEHMAKMSELCGEELKREEIETKVFASKPNKYRDAWIKAQGDSLRLLASDIRAAMNKFDRGVRIGICSASCSWDLDGVTALEISQILAGDTEPLLRLTGAPYWAVVHGDKTLPTVFEIARMHAAHCKDSGAELISEGDVYPRPRYIVPSAQLEMFDAVLRADGIYDGILKYMMDYNTSPYYDQGYIKRHIRNLTKHNSMSELFDGKRKTGVKIHTRPLLMKDADFTLSRPNHYSPYPAAGIMLEYCGIPTVHDGDGECLALFGENARHATSDELKFGDIIDGVAAAILTEKGTDVGLIGESSFANCTVPFMRTKEEESISVFKGTARINLAPVSEKADVLASYESDGKTLPLAYRYENEKGEKYLVFTFDAESLNKRSGLMRGYAVQKILKEGYEWLSGKPLPAFAGENPDVYTVCARGEGSLAVGIFNCFDDSIIDPTITLDREYGSVRFIGGGGTISGNTVILDGDIPPYSFIGFEAYD